MLQKDSVLADDLVIDFCDTDVKWGPFLFLRPERARRLGIWRIAGMSGIFGLFFGLLGSIALALVARGLDRPVPPLAAFPAALTLLYFAVCQLTIVPAWNRRAERLSRMK
jgi:membrane protein YdbS with pleckstrin-like domain